MSRKYSFAVDFDGTCTTHEYKKDNPEHVGQPIGAEKVLKRLTDNGHQIVIDTMRDGLHLEAAINWFKQNDIPIIGANEYPNQSTWTESTKTYASFSIDDRNIGVPFFFDANARRAVDWEKLEVLLEDMGCFD